ncbi:MAG TPA: hypothetical protein VIC26_15145 [Marinagarivorans sp.]
MPKDSSNSDINIALKDKDIPRAAAQAFRAAHLQALTSKAGVVVVSGGKLEHRHMKDGVLTTECIGEAPKPLIVGTGTRKKRR